MYFLYLMLQHLILVLALYKLHCIRLQPLIQFTLGEYGEYFMIKMIFTYLNSYLCVSAMHIYSLFR